MAELAERYEIRYLKNVLGVSATSIHKWEKKGIIPKAQRDKVSNRRFWTKEQLEDAKKRTGRA